MNITTDRDADRMLSLRASSRLPLPPEISLCDGYRADRIQRLRLFYEMYGVLDHPIIGMFMEREISIAMASAVSKAPHLDRVSHYSAWLGGRDPVRVIPDPLRGVGTAPDTHDEHHVWEPDHPLRTGDAQAEAVRVGSAHGEPSPMAACARLHHKVGIGDADDLPNQADARGIGGLPDAAEGDG